MRIVAISDLHNNFMRALPQGDILLIAGDFTSRGKVEEIVNFSKFLTRFKRVYKEIVVTPGNHDFLFEENEELARSLITDATVLINESHTLYNGMTIFGSPVVAPCWGVFNYDFQERMHLYDSIPNNTDILMTHTPAFGILDKVSSLQNVGCDMLRDKLRSMTQLKLHLFGHIHEDYGMVDHPREFTHLAVNSSICRRGIKEGLNEPVVIELND